MNEGERKKEEYNNILGQKLNNKLTAKLASQQ